MLATTYGKFYTVKHAQGLLEVLAMATFFQGTGTKTHLQSPLQVSEVLLRKCVMLGVCCVVSTPVVANLVSTRPSYGFEVAPTVPPCVLPADTAT